MPNCPNCGRATARTGDWACQWCGYPLLSKSYKKIAKNYRQLKEEKLDEPKPVPGEATEASVLPSDDSLPPATRLESSPELTLKPEPAAESKPALTLKAEPVLEAESTLAPEPVPESAAEPILEAELIAAEMDLTVEGLLSAYVTEGVAADAKFMGEIINLTGVVGRIEVKDVLDIHYIALNSAERDLLQSVRCVFERRYGPELMRLTIGQMVTVRGKYDGSIMDIRLKDCVLVR